MKTVEDLEALGKKRRESEVADADAALREKYRLQGEKALAEEPRILVRKDGVFFTAAAVRRLHGSGWKDVDSNTLRSLEITTPDEGLIPAELLRASFEQGFFGLSESRRTRLKILTVVGMGDLVDDPRSGPPRTGLVDGWSQTHVRAEGLRERFKHDAGRLRTAQPDSDIARGCAWVCGGTSTDGPCKSLEALLELRSLEVGFDSRHSRCLWVRAIDKPNEAV